MDCIKPTGCGDPNALQITEYCIFLGFYFMIMILSFIQIFKKFWSQYSLTYSSAYILFTFIIILSISKTSEFTIVRIVLCLDLWINMGSITYYAIEVSAILPFTVALITVTHSWLKLLVYFKYRDWLKRILIIRIISAILILCIMAADILFIVAFYHLLKGLVWLPWVVNGVIFIYYTILFLVCSCKVISFLKAQLPQLHRIYRKSIITSAIIVGLTITFRSALAFYIGFSVEYIKEIDQYAQIINILLWGIGEILPIFFIFLKIQVDLKNYKGSEVAIFQHHQVQPQRLYSENDEFPQQESEMFLSQNWNPASARWSVRERADS